MNKILIVDDDSDSRKLLHDLLAFFQYEVAEAPNGEEGIRMAAAWKPDLILMDIQMPVMNGLTTIKVLKDNPSTRGIKIIAVTSFAMRSEQEEIVRAGVDGYLAKPIHTRELMELVRKIMGERS
ncbi:MAG: response regulator [Candidatus Atribacteria bacterium]|nr:response regulator [Candidatus Atribacteria bacterium]